MVEPPDKDVSHYVRVEIELKRPCPVCGSRKAVRDGLTGEVCCSNCGLVLSYDVQNGVG
ncbi:MAG: TFIIB-type zinc ribbon-containing protein [Candidatus Bathyarchaeia archaeon]